MRDDLNVLVCARADAPKVLPGSIFTYACCICSARVMTAPSGQEMLRTLPHMVIVCAPCAAETVLKDPEARIGLAATPGQLQKEVRRAVPNFWSKRN